MSEFFGLGETATSANADRKEKLLMYEEQK